MAKGSRPPLASRLTIAGWATLGASFICTAAPLWQHPSPLALGLGLALLFCLLGTAWSLPRALRRPQAAWILPRSVHAGEEVTVGARLWAEQPTPALSLSAFDPARRQHRWIADLAGAGPAPLRVAWVQRFPHRGRVTLPPLTLHGEYPFGLIAGCVAAGAAADLLVYPALATVQGDLERQLLRWVAEGSRSPERGEDEPDHLRSYRIGDPPRAVHWRASARARELLVAVRQAPVARRLAILIDPASSAAQSTRVERLLVVAASLIDHLLVRGWLLSLHGPGAPDDCTQGDREALMTRLALTGTTQSDGQRLAELIPRDLPCLVLTTDPMRLPPGKRLLVLGPHDWDKTVGGR